MARKDTNKTFSSWVRSALFEWNRVEKNVLINSFSNVSVYNKLVTLMDNILPNAALFVGFISSIHSNCCYISIISIRNGKIAPLTINHPSSIIKCFVTIARSRLPISAFMHSLLFCVMSRSILDVHLIHRLRLRSHKGKCLKRTGDE